jgi:hypothetical protein
MLIIVPPLLVTAGTGLWLFLRGWRQRTDTGTLYCRTCGYNLSGLESQKCPECGRDIRDGAVWGRRSPRYRLVIPGALLLIIAVGVPVAWIGTGMHRYRWVRLVPTDWLITRYETAPVAYPDSVRELYGRLLSGRLSVEQRERLVGVCLDKILPRTQTPPTASAAPTTTTTSAPATRLDSFTWWMFMGAVGPGTLTADQCRRLREGLYSEIFLDVRPTARVGEPVPVRVGYELTPLGMQAPHADVNLEAKDTVMVGGQAQTADLSVLPFFLRSTAPSRVSGEIQFDRPGRQEVRVDLCVRSSRSPLGGVVFPVSAMVDVFPADSDADLTLVSSPELDAAIREIVQVADISLRRTGFSYGQTERWKVPVPCCFEVFARVDGQDYPLMSVVLRPDAEADHPYPDPLGYIPPPLGDRDTVDLVFKTNPALARPTIDISTLWNGEFVQEGVPLRHRRQTTSQPATQPESQPEAQPESRPDAQPAAAPAP